MAAGSAFGFGGQLDPSFGGEGLVTTAVGDYSLGRDVEVAPGGKAVVGADATPLFGDPDLLVVRYLEDGSLDSTFGGGDGVVRLNYTTTEFGSSFDQLTQVEIDSAGRILVGGTIAFNTEESFVSDFGVVRLHPDGSIDTTYGNDGWALAGLAESSFLRGMTLDASGRAVLAGFAGDDVAVARFTAGGDPDPGFGSGGTFTLDLGAHEIGTDVAAVPEGLVVSAHNFNDAFVLRVTNAGALDPRFNPDGAPAGVRRIDLGAVEVLDAIAVTPSGKAIAAGTRSEFGGGGEISTQTETTSSSDFLVVRLLADGGLDPAFDGDGAVLTDIGPFDEARDVALGPLRAIVVGGESREDVEGNGDFALARYAGTGALDPKFGNSGTRRTDFGGSDDSGLGVAVRRDARIFLTGSSTPSESFTQTVATARYIGLGACTRRQPTDVGTQGADEIFGSPGPDVIFGLGGADEIRAGDAEDFVCSGPGDDSVRGGDGEDTLRGAAGDDRVFGGALGDRLFGGSGADLLRGGRGTDFCRGGEGEDTLSGCRLVPALVPLKNR